MQSNSVGNTHIFNTHAVSKPNTHPHFLNIHAHTHTHIKTWNGSKFLGSFFGLGWPTSLELSLRSKARGHSLSHSLKKRALSLSLSLFSSSSLSHRLVPMMTVALEGVFEGVVVEGEWISPGFLSAWSRQCSQKTFFFFIEIGFLFRVALFVLENCRKFLLSCFTANFKGMFFN